MRYVVTLHTAFLLDAVGPEDAAKQVKGTLMECLPSSVGLLDLSPVANVWEEDKVDAPIQHVHLESPGKWYEKKMRGGEDGAE